MNKTCSKPPIENGYFKASVENSFNESGVFSTDKDEMFTSAQLFNRKPFTTDPEAPKQ